MTIDDGFDKTTILILMPSTLVVTHSQTRLKVGEMFLLDSNDWKKKLRNISWT